MEFLVFTINFAIRTNESFKLVKTNIPATVMKNDEVAGNTNIS